MGLIVLNFITEEGFSVPNLYIHVESIRILKTFDGSAYSCLFTSSAWKSVEDKTNGARSLPIPKSVAYAEVFLSSDEFYEQTIFGHAYGALKRVWQSAGYTVQDQYFTSSTPTTYIYDSSGYNVHGFNAAGYDRDGFNKEGYDSNGFDREGYDFQGWNREGYNRQGKSRTDS